MTSAADVQDVRLCLLGFGFVAQRFCEILADRSQVLEDRHGIRVLITAVGTGGHGSFSDPIGVTPRAVLAAYRQGSPGFDDEADSGESLIQSSEADVLIESTPLEHGAATAIAHCDAAFEHGLDVITVNKGPVAWAYQRMKVRAKEHNRRFRFEGVTMDGCPIYNLAEFCLPGDRITGFRGVLNSTTNYVIDAIAEGATLDEALAEAQSEGIAETDPSFDIDGHDAAAKVAALANVLLDADITPDSVQRDSIRELTPDDLARVISYGRRLRVICSASVDETDAVRAQATLEHIRSDDPMYWISGTSSALVIDCELAGTIEIVERDGLLTQTAYAVYADLLTLFGRRAS